MHLHCKRSLCLVLSGLLAVTSVSFPVAAEEAEETQNVDSMSEETQLSEDDQTSPETELILETESSEQENWLSVASEVLKYYAYNAVQLNPVISEVDRIFYDVIPDNMVKISDASYFLQIYAAQGSGIPFDGYIPKRDGQVSIVAVPGVTTTTTEPEEVVIPTETTTVTTTTTEPETTTSTTVATTTTKPETTTSTTVATTTTKSETTTSTTVATTTTKPETTTSTTVATTTTKPETTTSTTVATTTTKPETTTTSTTVATTTTKPETTTTSTTIATTTKSSGTTTTASGTTTKSSGTTTTVSGTTTKSSGTTTTASGTTTKSSGTTTTVSGTTTKSSGTTTTVSGTTTKSSGTTTTASGTTTKSGSTTTTAKTTTVVTTTQNATTTVAMPLVRKGIDVSVYQGQVDWQAVKASGVDFAIIRAGYGKHLSQEDKYFDTNMKNAQAAGIQCGAYWFSYALTPEDAQKEADVFYEVIKGYQFEYPVCFDYETSQQYALTPAESTAIIEAFCDRMESYGYYVSLCSYVNFLNTRIESEVFSKYDSWIAHYNVSSPQFYHSYGIWQYSCTGTVSGISAVVDLDYAYYDYPQIMKDHKLNGF